MKKKVYFLLPVFSYGAGQSIFRIASKIAKRLCEIEIICLGKCAYKQSFIKKGINESNNKTLYNNIKKGEESQASFASKFSRATK